MNLMEQLAVDAQSMPMGDRVVAGLLVTVFSMVIVFAVLILLMYLIKGLGNVIVASENKKKAKEAPAQASTPIAGPGAQSKTDDSEVVAAIMAAVASCASGSDVKIVIRNIEKKQDNWATVGLLEQMNSRL